MVPHTQNDESKKKKKEGTESRLHGATMPDMRDSRLQQKQWFNINTSPNDSRASISHAHVPKYRNFSVG